jgi:hypothetical protein
MKMKKINLLLFLCVSYLGFAQNLIENGDFEAQGSIVGKNPGPVSWQDGSGFRIVDDSGDLVGEVESGGVFNEAQQSFTIEDSKTYRVSFRYRWHEDLGLTVNKSGRATVTQSGNNTSVVRYNLGTEETWTAASFDFTGNPGETELFITLGPPGLNANNIALRFDDLVIEIEPTIKWVGTQNTNWATGNNWDSGTTPVSTDIVLIPTTGVTHMPTATAITVDKIIIESGASLIATASVTADVTYKLSVPDTNWHLISSPINTELYDEPWILRNSITRGTGANRAIAPYQNGTPNVTTGPWTYFQGGGASTSFDGGYSLKRNVPGVFSFTGTFPEADVISPAITQDVTNWNLIGNPFPSYIDIVAFLSANATPLSDPFEAVYVWDAATSSYNALTTGYIHPGQAFFVNSAVAGTSVSITEAMQSHLKGVFYRDTQSNPSIHLSLSNGALTKTTEINYLDGKTTGLDSRFDVGMFNGVSSDIRIYTHLIEESQGIGFTKQALPDNNFKNMIIPVGVKASSGTEITISASAANLPAEINVYLEDKDNNSFTLLDNASNFFTTLSSDLNGIGRFYLHTTSSVLSIGDVHLDHISVYTSNRNNLRIVGVQQGTAKVSLYNILGKKVLSSSFQGNGMNDVTLPNFKTGVYIIQLETENGILNKKVMINE